ncbi:LOW QUALITY PROTEIN: hypothetical protein PSENEW3n2_00001796 [Picochlorum sp. SENEW3]|nr:LOW QUALITY PROTEIN: hypothetical protein PSENEW3n2_00001796 [Picochlorum sp. SENEW3]WPT14566.1 LOW QUALITY PROTEIN: hypothetical protein PSENEW3_00001796 [Picochlorum sp. SENEW3]
MELKIPGYGEMTTPEILPPKCGYTAYVGIPPLYNIAIAFWGTILCIGDTNPYYYAHDVHLEEVLV